MTNLARNITINYEASTIEVSKAFFNKASKFGSAEYRALRAVRLENEGFSVGIKTIEKKTYKDLTIDTMAEYIRTQENSKKMLVKFEAVKKVAKAKKSLYPLTKKWFLKTFPEYKKAEVENEISSKLLSDVEKELAELAEEDSNIIPMKPRKEAVNQ